MCAASAGLDVNMPRASMVAKTPTASIKASPKDIPILVFIYSILLFYSVGGDHVSLFSPFGLAWTGGLKATLPPDWLSLWLHI
jgi:hypothetical protein